MKEKIAKIFAVVVFLSACVFTGSVIKAHADGIYQAAVEGVWSYPGTKLEDVNNPGYYFCRFTRTADRCDTTCPMCNPHLKCNTNNVGGQHYTYGDHALVGGGGGCNYQMLDGEVNTVFWGARTDHKETTFCPSGC